MESSNTTDNITYCHQSPSEYIKQLEAQRDALQAELVRYQEAIRQGLWGDTAPDEPHGKEIFVIRREVVKLHAELARVREALVAIAKLTRFELPELNNTDSWKRNLIDIDHIVQAALQPSRGEQGVSGG